jgi:hypothetical protein
MSKHRPSRYESTASVININPENIRENIPHHNPDIVWLWLSALQQQLLESQLTTNP